MKNQHLHKKLFFSLNGLKHAFKLEHSLKIELFCSILLIVFFIYFDASITWFALGIISSCIMLSAELINTAFEAYLDHFHPQFDRVVGLIKDILSGSVFITQVMTFIIFMLFVVSQVF
ncbi:MAG TPA: diacylglycerol kinase [Oligoflexia bacterium]|nr:diacylglycerol kinase [Oligoflexia bacterium]HMR24450.1 diacylglycerol kinase [Oligoflexia bacterium]